MLDEGQHPGGHEPGGAHRRAAAGELGDLDDATAMGDVDAAAGPGRLDLVRQGAAAGINDDLDAVAFNRASPIQRGKWDSENTITRPD
jgi:hypothetical protein